MAGTIPQKLFSHGGIYVLVRLSNRATGFVLMPLYAAYLGEEGYGALSIITATSSMVMTVSMQGQIGAWGRLRYGLNEADRRRLETSIFWYTALSVSLCVLLLGIFGEGLARKYVPGVDFDLIRLGLLAAALQVPLLFYNRTLQEAQKPRAFFFLNLTSTVVNTLLIVILVAGVHWGLTGVLLAQVATGIILFIGALYLLKPGPPWKMQRDLVSQGFRFGAPVVAHSLATQVDAFADRMMVNYLIGASATGNYSMGYKLASVVSLAGTSLNQAFNPLLNRGLTNAKTASEAERLRIWESIRKAALYQVAVVALLGLAMATGGREVIFVLAGGRFEQAWQVIPVVSGATLLVATYQPFAGCLIYAKKTSQLFVVSGSGATVNLLLNWLLIPRIGMIGAAIATFCSSLVFLAIIWWLTRRLFQPLVGMRWLWLLALTLATLTVLGTADWLVQSWWMRIPVKVLVAGVGAGGIFLLTGAKPKDLKGLFNRTKRKKQRPTGNVGSESPDATTTAVDSAGTDSATPKGVAATEPGSGRLGGDTSRSE